MPNEQHRTHPMSRIDKELAHDLGSGGTAKSSERRYTAWNGEAMTFDRLVEELDGYIAHLLLQTTPYEYVSDSKQEAFLQLWKALQDDTEWIAKRRFTSKSGLARRLAYDGRQQPAAWGPVQRLYESRVANEASLNDWLAEGVDDADMHLPIGDHPRTRNTDFWRDLSEMEPRNLDVILYPDGCHPEWQGLADMRIDLVAAIDHVFERVKKDKHGRTGWALMSLVYGITVEQAAFMAGITRPAMNAHVIQCRKLMREKLLPYADPDPSKPPQSKPKKQPSRVRTKQEPEPQTVSQQAVSPLAIPFLNTWLKVLSRVEQEPPKPSIPAKEEEAFSPQLLFTAAVWGVLVKLAQANQTLEEKAGRQSTAKKAAQATTHAAPIAPQTVSQFRARTAPPRILGSSYMPVLVDGIALRYPL